MTERNVVDLFKNWTLDLIKDSLVESAFEYAVLMEQFVGDFNIGTVIRNANAFGAKSIYYLGKRQYDRRGTVGTHLYKDVIHLKAQEDLVKLKDKYTFIGLENVPGATILNDFKWPQNSLIILGEEGVGVTKETLALCDKVVEIKMYGSVRSLNAGCASGIAMFDYVNKQKINATPSYKR